MARITRPGGAVLALAEPDYGGRIDYPIKLAQMGKWQIESLRLQGADPLMGRKLATIFNSAGFDSVETGVLGGQWSPIRLLKDQGSKNLTKLPGKLGSGYSLCPRFTRWGKYLNFKSKMSKYLENLDIGLSWKVA